MSLAFWRRNTATSRCCAYLQPEVLVVANSQQQIFELALTSAEQWSKAFASLSQQAKLGSDQQIVFILGKQYYQQFQVDKPQVANEELQGAVPWTIKDMVTEPLSDLAIDYYAAPSNPMAGEKLTVVCVRKSIIQQLVTLAQQHDITIEGITIESLAVVNFMEQSERCQMLLWQAKGGDLELIVARQGQVCFSRQLRAFSALGKMQEIEFTQNFFDSLSLELQRSIDYISATLKLPEVSAIQLAIPSRFCDTIAQQLQQNLSPKVGLLEVPLLDSSEQYYQLPALAGLQPGVLS
ncbi:hypothetical protein [Agarivorans sp.]|uniref:hypothetical protein n=1 Tax=Agarivorans sp. TaxID=1872412 RepID=UPI003D05C72D